ncbi:tail fiber domain-containing protein [Emticicia sp. C21]|uniref:tail fiber domain-containing protein n=1 Tax=Emticicia sp. C21 TaxID=2302915 RepID=UPI001314C347|nr:tail fiber domain-containing protein [Emticicia sp. C21]
MKKLSLLFITLFSVSITFAQSTEILPGLVLPQMTTAQRMSIIDPANGMLVFDKNTKSYWYWQNDDWTELPKGGSTSNYWNLSGNAISNTNTGGFWSKNPVGVSYYADNVSNPPTVPANEFGTRLMWIPSRSAFRVGTANDTIAWSANNIGIFSFATGFNTRASGKISTAMGFQAQATNLAAVSIGFQSKAIGSYTTAIGNTVSAEGENSIAIGYYAKTLGIKSIALGSETTAEGDFSTAMGESTIASGKRSTAMGDETFATADASTSTGYHTLASGYASFATGYTSKAKGSSAFASGFFTEASGNYSLSSGYLTVASGNKSTALGAHVNTAGKEGSFIIGDSDPLDQGTTSNTVNDQFMARFKNGYYLLTSGDKNRTGVYLSNGQTAWNSISDSTRKERYVKADGESFLTKLKNLRLGSWNYKNEGIKAERFYGPMAQEIFAAFGKDTYGTIGTDTTVSTINMDGLLFIFSQALEKRTTDLQTENQQLKAELLALKDEAKTFKDLLHKLDGRLASIELQDVKAEIQSSKMKAGLAKKDIPNEEKIVNDK